MLDDLIKVKKPPNYLYGKQLVAELYETKFGICDHRYSASPLSGVQFNEAEQYIKGGLFEHYLELFLLKGLASRLSMSFDEFLARPRYEIESILSVADEVNKRKMETEEGALTQLKNLQSQSKL